MKTQFGPVEGHVALVELLAALKKCFLPNLEVRDEGGYWETRDLRALERTFAHVQAAINALAEGLQRSGLSAEAAEDPEILLTRIERIARQVQQTLARPAEHPPVHFADDFADEAGVDATEDEATWDALFKENRRKQERIHRAIEERLHRGEEPGDAFDNAMPEELALDLPDDPDFPDATQEFDEPSAVEDEEPWTESLRPAGDDVDRSPSAARDDADFHIERHPIQRRAMDLMLRLHKLAGANESARGGHWDILLRGAGEIMGGLAQALSADDWEGSRGLRIVQLKRALRGAAFARGALPPLCASGAINESVYRELGDALRSLATDIHHELNRVRTED